MGRTDRQTRAEEMVREAIGLFIEARRELTLWEFEQFIRENITTLGYHGFIGSMGQAMVNAATTEARRALSEQETSA